MSEGNGNGSTAIQQQTENVPALAPPRLPYHPAVEERFGIDKASWKALVEAVFPAAQSPESIILALSYCRARNLDPFKKNVHIVPIWDKNRRCLVDTVWPGIGELRTTAFRTQQYAGRDATNFGPDTTNEWGTDKGKVRVTHPEWAQVTVYRLIGGERVPFQGPPVYWLETYSDTKSGAPNSMWQKRPRGQIDKCAEAAALRAAFPEEIGDQFTEADGPALAQYGGRPGVPQLENHQPAPTPGRHSLADEPEAPAALPSGEQTVAAGSNTHLDPPAEGATDAPQQADDQATDSPAGDPSPLQQDEQGEPPEQDEDQQPSNQQQGRAPFVGELERALEQRLGLEGGAGKAKLRSIAADEYGRDASKLKADERRQIAQRIEQGELDG